MRNLFRFLNRLDRNSYKYIPAYSQFHTSTKMASASTAAVLYASVISASQLLGKQPEDAEELKHHVKGGKGFINPWPSFTEHNAWWFMRSMLLYDRFLCISNTNANSSSSQPAHPGRAQRSRYDSSNSPGP
jgi:hypothetical protein